MKNQLRILVIEAARIPEAGIASIFREALSEEFQLSRAGSLKEAGRILRGSSNGSRRLDAIVLDLDLADAEGYAAIAQLHKDHAGAALLGLSGRDDVVDAAQQCGGPAAMEEVIHKNDLNPRLLRGAIRRGVARCRSSAGLRAVNLRLEEENRRLLKLRRTAHRFVDNVSHEFRTPLTVIKEFASIIGEGLAGEITQQQQEFLSIINDRADDLAVMVDDMLDTSKLEAGLLSVWRRRCNVAEIVDRLRATLQRKAEVKKIGLQIVVPDELPEVYCDPEKIARVIINLAVNSIKFAADDGCVTLRAAHDHENSQILVSVSDDGPGIEPDQLQRIFRRFHQAARTALFAGEGHGLGLNIAKELVDLNLGQIDVVSKPGQGSTFSFSVPLFDPPNLVNRHLRRLRAVLGQAARLSLLVATTDPQHGRVECGPDLSVVADEFLQHTFRGDDLVIRSHANKWVVLSCCGRDRIDELIARVQNDWTQINLNRPGQKFPAIRLSFRGNWSIAAEGRQLRERHCKEMHAQPEGPPSPRILVVDDDRELTRGLGIRLKAAGYDVITANDGKSGMETAVNVRPDAILMDNYMSGLGGMEVLGRLRQNPKTTDIPVIMLSGGIREKQKALKRGARYFLHKPCDPKTVAAAIDEVIAAKATADCQDHCNRPHRAPNSK